MNCLIKLPKQTASRISMRKISLIINFFILSAPVFSQTKDITKHALIFAIGNYPESGGWPKISSLHDVQYIQNILSQQGFQEKNIRVVPDQDATLNGIKNAFEELAMNVNKGDIVLIHFSSHGEQVEADNNNKMDGLDECVVTYNALAPSKSKDYLKDQAEYLRGHMLGSYIRKLRVKAGSTGDVIVFMDNCFSGDGTRGASSIRGGKYPFVSNTFNPIRHRKSDSSFLYKEEFFSDNEKDVAPYEVISATRPDEVDYETRDEATNTSVGSLTYAISKAFANMQSGSALPTYRALFANIQATMNTKVPNQHPLLEGNENDRIIFGGLFKYQMPYIEISKVDKENNQVTVRQGEMAGLSVGANISLFPAGTLDTAKAVRLARGVVVKSENFSSVATIDKKIQVNNAAEAWAFVSAYSYKIEPVSIKLVSGKSKKSIQKFSSQDLIRIQKFVSGLSYVKFSDNPEMIIVRGKKEDSLKINANGYLFATVKNIVADSMVLRDKLESYARYKFLQTLHCQIKNVNVDVQLVPIVNGLPDTNKMKDRFVNNTFVTYEKDTLTLRIINSGKKDVYVNILDMQPDGTINPVLPNSNLAYPIYAHDLKISAGQDFFLPRGDFIIVSPPYGTEVFKVFASEKEMDLESVATTRGASRNGIMTMIEELVNNSYTISRGGATGSTMNADASTSEFVFLIKPQPKKQAQ